MYVYYFGLPILTLAAVIDAGVMVQLRYLNGQPSLLLILVISWGLLNELRDALPWAVMGGAIADLLSVAPTGSTSLGLVLALILIYGVFGKISRRNLIIPPIAVGVGTVITQLVVMLILILSGWGVPVTDAILRWILPSMLFNFVGVLFVFRLMGWIVEFFRPPPSVLQT